MTRKLTHIAIMAFFLSSLAFAGDRTSSTSSDDPAGANAVSSEDTTAKNKPCVTSGDQNDKKDKQKDKNKNKAKPAPTDQEKEFDKVLLGIYG